MKISQLAAALLAVSVSLLPAQGGVVTTSDGVTVTGNVLLVGPPGTEPKITVQIPGKAARQFKLSDIKTAFLDARGEGSREADGVPWSRTEIGETKRAGIVEINGNRISIRDTSDGFRIGRQKRVEEASQTDSCCFVFQKLDGDGEIQGRVLPNEATRWARGGFMICEGLDGTGPLAFIARTADPVASILFTRLRANDVIAITADAKNLTVPAPWLKLTRAGRSFKAFESLDGKSWTLIGEKTIAMDEKKGVYIGVAATGNSREGTVAFESIKLTGKRSVPGLENVSDSRLPDICAILHNGTLLSGSLESITDGVAKFKRAGSGETITLPLSAIARAQFAPLTRAQAQKFQTTTTGLLTRDGDFLDGDIKDIKPDAVTVSSIAFGLTTMERARVFGLVFPAPAAAPAQDAMVNIRLSDGSVIAAKKVTLEKDHLIIEEPLLGTMKIALKEVMSIERRAV